jgi:pectate lyase
MRKTSYTTATLAWVNAIILTALMASSACARPIPAFPGAEGYGSVTSGGRGGKVIAVTNLNDTGPGSLRAAVEAEGPRIVVFRVSGTIELDRDLRIQHPYITIAGQTAPGDGITIKGYLGINANDVIIRYIRVRTDGRLGDGDAINGRGRSNIILDHVSASWGTDEVLSIYAGENVTIQNTIISEAVGDGESHKFGGIWGDKHSTYHHNLFAHNAARNPRLTSGIKVDFRNNVLYNWGHNSLHGGHKNRPSRGGVPTKINVIANYYKPGPATRAVSRIAQPMARGEDDRGDWYVADNYVHGHPDLTANNWLGVHGNNYVKLDEPWPAMPINQQSAEEAYETVLARVGASLPKRDSVDARIIEEVRTGAATHGNGIISSPSDVGGWPELESAPAPVDTSGNGIPDWWLQKYGLDVHDPEVANQDLNGTGYPNIEEYLNGTDPARFVDYTKPENNINTLKYESLHQ